MSTMSHSIFIGKRAGSVSCRTLKASRSALAEARWPPPVSLMRIWIVATSSSAWRRVLDGYLVRGGLMAVGVGWNAVVAARERSQRVVESAIFIKERRGALSCHRDYLY